MVFHSICLSSSSDSGSSLDSITSLPSYEWMSDIEGFVTLLCSSLIYEEDLGDEQLKQAGWEENCDFSAMIRDLCVDTKKKLTSNAAILKHVTKLLLRI